MRSEKSQNLNFFTKYKIDAVYRYSLFLIATQCHDTQEFTAPQKCHRVIHVLELLTWGEGAKLCKI